jgi:hypothetical protein
MLISHRISEYCCLFQWFTASIYVMIPSEFRPHKSFNSRLLLLQSTYYSCNRLPVSSTRSLDFRPTQWSYRHILWEALLNIKKRWNFDKKPLGKTEGFCCLNQNESWVRQQKPNVIALHIILCGSHTQVSANRVTKFPTAEEKNKIKVQRIAFQCYLGCFASSWGKDLTWQAKGNRRYFVNLMKDVQSRATKF